MLRDIDWQPRWRARADIDADYYDSNQYDSETLQLMEERGIPPIIVNLIAPVINLILGMEAKTRQDWIVSADDDKNVDFALAMTQKLQWAERGAKADRACADAYAPQVKAGLGWVHTRPMTLNPFAFPYRCEYVHRREIWWDWHATDPMLSDARWLVRRKWHDYDLVTKMFPQHRALIDQIMAGWSMFEHRAQMDVAHPLYQDWLSSRDFSWTIDEWRNPDRKRVALYEVWYRVWNRGYVLETRDGRKMEFNRERPDPMHVEVLQRGLGSVRAATMPKVRLSWWIGPHRLVDVPTPLPHEEFPYVPFWGYREDRTGVPYGHIRVMRPMQDEVNARRARMLWQLSARRIIADDDAVKDKKALELEAARADAAIYLNPNRINKGSIEQSLRIDDNQSLTAQQFTVYTDSKETMQDLSNTFKEQLGKAGAADSGIAISQLIEQGTTALAGLNDNYQIARTAVGNQLYAFLRRDMEKQQEAITVDRGAGRKRVVKLNEPKYDKDLGLMYRSNDVATTQASVALNDVPSSPSFRQYQFKELVNLVKGLPSPELQGAMLDMVIEASDVPNKDEIAQRVRDALGLTDHNVDAMSEEELKAYQQKMDAQEMMNKVQEALTLLAKEKADLENRELDAKVEKLEKESDKLTAQVEEIHANIVKTEAEVEHMDDEPEDESASVPGVAA